MTFVVSKNKRCLLILFEKLGSVGFVQLSRLPHLAVLSPDLLALGPGRGGGGTLHGERAVC